jgi:hypothetical protein
MGVCRCRSRTGRMSSGFLEQEASEHPIRGKDDLMHNTFGTSSDEEEDEGVHEDDEKGVKGHEEMMSRGCRPATCYSYVGVELYLKLDEC